LTGLLDIEYNTGGNTGHEKNNHTLIEISLLIADERNNYIVAEVYDTVVKPPKGRTIINEKIRQLTSISQQEIDNGTDMITVYRKLNELYKKYRLKTVYTWGSCDEDVMRWNYMQYNIGSLTGIPATDVCIPFTDLSKELKDKYNLRHVISLINMAVLFDCIPQMQHRAYADAETMRNILICLELSNNADIRKKFKTYDEYADLRYMYSQMKKVISTSEEYGIKIDELIKTAKLGADFPEFSDSYNDTYDKKIFGWL